MKNKKIMIGILLGLVTVIVFATSKSDIYAEILKSQRLVNDVYKHLITNYVDDFDVQAFTRNSIEDMVGELDPYTIYIEADQRHSIDLLTTGKYGGVGIQIGKRDGRLTVIAPMDDTPAEKAGITNGDIIVKIDSVFTDDLSLDEASNIIRGEKGTKVSLFIERYGNDELIEFVLIRDNIVVKDVAFAELIDDDIGYIRLTRFSTNSAPEMRAALKKLIDANASAFILDLRNNPGGLLGASIEILDMMLPKGELLLTTKGRTKESNREIFSKRNPIVPDDMEIVVLISEGSASASEIVAGTLQDLDRAIVIGKTSFGKGLVQTVVSLDKERALKITTAKYYTPSGRLIQKPGYIDEELLVNKIEEDTLFTTVGGRTVKGGGGIRPDIEVDVEYNFPLTYACLRKGQFMAFVTEKKNSYSNIDEVKADNKMLKEFQKFIVANKVEVITAGEKALSDTKERLFEIDSTNAELNNAFTAIEHFINSHEETLFEKEKDKLSEFLYEEFASVYGGDEGRFKEQLHYDKTVNEAIEVLKDKSLLSSIFIAENQRL
jgi:carboxyl-terminal processing protease